MTPAEARLHAWIAEAAQVEPATITRDTRLVAERIVTSLMILDLVLLIEELRGAPLDPATLVPASFQSIAAIAAAFLREDRHG